MPVTFPSLGFIQNGRQKRKTKSAHKSAIFSGRLNSPTSPHPYATTQVFDIHDANNTVTADTESESFIQDVPEQSSLISQRIDEESPRVVVNFTSEPLTDWFPQNLLRSDTALSSYGTRDESQGADETSGSEYSTSLAEKPNGDDHSVSVYGDLDETDKASSSEDILANLESLDASSFITSEGQDPSRRHEPMSYKKSAPAPIKIPNAAFRNSKVQIVRSARSNPQSRPHSIGSSEDASAVSGTTLARALIGNSYVLSGDNRASRYRSGTSVLTRQDSATLPHFDYLSAVSPGNRDRKMSGGENTLSPDSVHVPPVPSNAESVYVPPKLPRRARADMDSPPTSNGRKRTSTGSIKLGGVEAEFSTVTLTRSHSASNIKECALPDKEEPVEADADATAHVSSPSEVPTPDPPSSIPSSRPTSFSPDNARSSTTSSDLPSSANLLDNVLDYYELAEPTEPLELVNQPAKELPQIPDPTFRPAFSPIAEESLISSSPASPNNRNSTVSQVAKSSASPLGQFEISVPQSSSPARESKKYSRTLLPIGERPKGSPANITLAQLAESSSSANLLPPSKTSIFNRQRSGSAPSPIKVVRDSRDITAYNITVSPRPGSSLGTTPTSAYAETEGVNQTFPETPNLFSPAWSTGALSETTAEDRPSSNYAAPMPPSPKSAGPLGGAPNFAQQILLTRAATSVRGIRHSRQASLGRARAFPAQPLASSSSHPTRLSVVAPPDEDAVNESSNSDQPDTDDSRRLSVSRADDHSLPERSESSSSSPRLLATTSESAAAIEPEGRRRPPSLHSSQTTRSTTPDDSSSISSITPSQALQPTTPDSSSHINATPGNFSREDLNTPAIGSPPPYYSVIYEQANPVPYGSITPGSGGSTQDTESRFGYIPRSPSIQSAGGRRRTRPPLPVGPRRPSQHSTPLSSAGLSTPGFSGPRARDSSFSSINSAAPNVRRPVTGGNAPPSPKFQTQPVRWRGYTVEQAKWTFSSAQLQAIVSRAIKQSAEASSIRLLPIEVLDHDVPNEMRQLEMRRTDIKTRYRILTRRRADIMVSLTLLYSEATAPSDQDVLKLIEDLNEITFGLDKLAEDLHSVDEQISQLRSLREVHSASALAMALRKLNSSFMKQLGDTERLQAQVIALEAEKEEAWRQAESVAAEYDQLNRRGEVASSESSKRSSRVLAARKSSIRVSRARSSLAPSRRSSVSSMGNNRLSISALSSGAKSSFSVEDIPPVPPMPSRPFNIRTDLPSRVSMGISTDGFTPTSETRAMVKAQDELYEILGYSPRGHRRAHSVRASDGEPSRNNLVGRTSLDRGNDSHPGTRPASLPGPASLLDSNAIDPDRNAMLTTLEMLSSDP